MEKQKQSIYEIYSDFKKIDKKEEVKNHSLGINAKSSSPLEEQKVNVYQAYSEKNTAKKDLEKELYQKYRIKRYTLLKTARRYFIDYANKNNISKLQKVSRTIHCKHTLSENGSCVTVDFNENNAFYMNLQTCGSVWTCPVCASKIQEKRRKEIAKAIDYFYENKKQSVMVTFTFPHSKNQSLEELLKKQSEALKIFRSGKTWDKFKNRIDFSGLIRALEITHGRNGWHPHTHELWFIDKNIKPKGIQDFITERWLDCCYKVGLLTKDKFKAFKENAVNIKMNCKASNYLAKQDSAANWGIDRELAKSANKGNGKGKNPFEFLAEDNTFNQNLFIEFSQAVKGKSQLFWSHGLKEKIGIKDIKDEEIAEEEIIEEVEKIQPKPVNFTFEQWKAILKKEYRAQVLNRLENTDDLSSEYLQIIQVVTGTPEEDKDDPIPFK